MIKIISWLVLLSVLLIGACSSRHVYETLQSSQRLQCQKLPPADFEECMQRTRKSYDEYKQERDELGVE